jgi:hypothetical protein
VGAGVPALLQLHKGRTDAGADRAPADAWWSSDAAVSGVAAETVAIRDEEQSPPDGDTEREMSEENVGIVRGLYDMLNVGGAEAVRRLLAPDVVLKEPPEQPGGDGILRYGRGNRGLWEVV